jgi:heptosyltransferase-2
MKRILVVRTDRVGDVVMITPMIKALRTAYPDAFIAALTDRKTRDVLVNNPSLDLLLDDDLTRESFWSVVKALRSHSFTHALLTWPTERAAYQLFLAGIRTRIGVGHKLYEIITFMRSVSRNNYIPPRHEADYCMDLARAIGVKSDNLTPAIFPTEEEKEWGRGFMESLGAGSGSARIAVHTGSGNSSANWSEAKYEALIQKMLERDTSGKIRIVLTALEMSPGLVSRLKSLDPQRVLPVAEHNAPLRRLIKIVAACDVLIASSTGPLHIASALGVRTIGLFCHRPTNCVQRWGALGPKAVNIEVSASHCDAHCGVKKEPCVFEDGIGVEEVLKNLRF